MTKALHFGIFEVENGELLPDLTGQGHDGRIFGAQTINAAR